MNKEQGVYLFVIFPKYLQAKGFILDKKLPQYSISLFIGIRFLNYRTTQNRWDLFNSNKIAKALSYNLLADFGETVVYWKPESNELVARSTIGSRLGLVDWQGLLEQ
jgi:hypothetical protein